MHRYKRCISTNTFDKPLQGLRVYRWRNNYIIGSNLGNCAACCYHFLLKFMGSRKIEGLIILHTGGPCIMEASGVWGIKPTHIVTEAHTIVTKKLNPIVSLSISIYICLIIDLLLPLGFISPTPLVTEIGPHLASSTSTLALIYLDGLLLVLRNIFLIFLVMETNDTMVWWITIETRIKNSGRNIERTWCAQGVMGSVS